MSPLCFGNRYSDHRRNSIGFCCLVTNSVVSSFQIRLGVAMVQLPELFVKRPVEMRKPDLIYYIMTYFLKADWWPLYNFFIHKIDFLKLFCYISEIYILQILFKTVSAYQILNLKNCTHSNKESVTSLMAIAVAGTFVIILYSYHLLLNKSLKYLIQHKVMRPITPLALIDFISVKWRVIIHSFSERSPKLQAAEWWYWQI